MINLTENQIRDLQQLEATYALFLDKIPERYKKVTSSDIPKDVEKMLKKSLSENKGMYLFGNCGVGKTHISYAIYKHFLDKKYTQGKVGIEKNLDERTISYHCDPEIRVYNWQKIIKLLKDTIGKREDYVIDNFNPRGILVLDDAGAEKATDWTIENLYYLINDRYEKNLITIVTSNFSLKELAERIGDRIPSRIAEMCNVIKLSGKDKRI